MIKQWLSGPVANEGNWEEKKEEGEEEEEAH